MNAQCLDTVGARHGFDVALWPEVIAGFAGRSPFVHGVRVVGSVGNEALSKPGLFVFPSPPALVLAGTYRSSGGSPRVFLDRAELEDSSGRARIARTASESAELEALQLAPHRMIQNAHNQRAKDSALACHRYSNHPQSSITALLAVARLLDRRDLFYEAFYGAGTLQPVVHP